MLFGSHLILKRNQHLYSDIMGSCLDLENGPMLFKIDGNSLKETTYETDDIRAIDQFSRYDIAYYEQKSYDQLASFTFVEASASEFSDI